MASTAPAAGAEASVRPITFRFDEKKFEDAMVFLAQHVSDLTTLKAAKLLYLADREHVLKHGRPILGDWYACMDHGPVPSRAYDIMKELRNPDARGSKLVERLKKRLTVTPSEPHPSFSSTEDAKFEHLSPSELAVLNEVVQRHGGKRVGALIDITHEHAAWKKCSDDGVHQMDYLDFFAESPETAEVRELMEQEQEDRDFMAKLTA
jgi:uncharacterized phage-associated protein